MKVIGDVDNLPVIMKKNEGIIAVLFVAIFVFAFNFEAIFGLDVLLLDDNSRYRSAVSGNIVIDHFLNKSLPSAMFKALNMKLMLLGMEVARLSYLLLFAIPLSLALYYFNRRVLDLDLVPSLVSAVIVNILPFQLHIPKFIDGSYPVRGLFFLFLSLIFATKFLKNGRMVLLGLSAAFWYLSSHAFAEFGIILFPALLFLFVLFEGKVGKKVVLISVFLLVLAPSVSYYFSNDRNSSTPVSNDFATIALRIKNTVEKGAIFDISTQVKRSDVKKFVDEIQKGRLFDGYAENKNLYFASFKVLAIVGGIVGIWLLGFLVSMKGAEGRQKRQVLLLYGFYLVFGVCALAPFWTISPRFGVRYLYTPFVAFWPLVVFSLYAILVTIRMPKKLIFVLFVCMLCLAGFNRHVNQEKENQVYNKKNQGIQRAVNGFGEIRQGGQIVIANKKNGTGGFFIWSTGYLQYMLKRGDVVGLIGAEKNFYDPFNVKHRGYSYKMEGLELDKPLYAALFRGAKYYQPDYFLRWQNEKSSKSSWTLFEKDETSDLLKVMLEGEGIDEYKESLELHSIRPEEVLWGNYERKNALKGFKNGA